MDLILTRCWIPKYLEKLTTNEAYGKTLLTFQHNWDFSFSLKIMQKSLCYMNNFKTPNTLIYIKYIKNPQAD